MRHNNTSTVFVAMTTTVAVLVAVFALGGTVLSRLTTDRRPAEDASVALVPRSDEQVTVTWTPPPTPMASPYFFYRLTFSQGVEGVTGSDFTWTGTVQNCTFTPSKAELNPTPSPNIVFADYPRTYNLVVACTGSGTFTPYLTSQVAIVGEEVNVAADSSDDIAARTVQVLTDPVLTVTKNGTGTGYVSSTTSSFQCGLLCTAVFPPNIYGTKWPVTLRATADPGSIFIGWSGGCTGTSTCKVTMSGPAWVTATFERAGGVSVTKVGRGNGSITSKPAGISCSTTATAPCLSWHKHGTTLTLTATPVRNSRFVGWTGACTGKGTCIVQVDAVNRDPLPVYAIFE